ncbi:MAG: tRNA uridine(34) 5-carboxymethylaminomethyl modification radical SAM/GNAT enzyme Elp3, partial [Candidatus Thermoplasmatota archaeon]
MKEYFKELIDELLKSDEEVHKLKLRVCKKYNMHRIPKNSEIIEYLRNEGLDLEKKLVQKLKTKRTRTLSGVGVVAVMCSPSSCPHGKCIYCPGGVEYGSAQSYTGKEPASLRALTNEYDPYKQTDARIKQLNAIGHTTEKLDLIIMGGTFLAREKEYKEWFLKNCYDAMNGFTSKNLEEAKKMNESATSRCVG